MNEPRQWRCYTGMGSSAKRRSERFLGGLDYTTVSREVRKRLRERAQEDKKLGATLKEIEDGLRHK